MRGSEKMDVDLVMFMGQSNMAGRGEALEAPKVPSGYGYEFRAISDPTRLYHVEEPFGVDENTSDGVNEPGRKTGSLVSAFIIAYYKLSGVPIVGVSVAKGGSSINRWQPGEKYLDDAVRRFQMAQSFLKDNGYTIRKRFMVWCQGETDGDNNMPALEYKSKLQAMIETMLSKGVEKCFIIRIGNHRELAHQYSEIKQAQTDYCNICKEAIMVSTQFEQMAALGLMKDSFHYKQVAYNRVGEEAGKNTALYINNEALEMIF